MPHITIPDVLARISGTNSREFFIEKGRSVIEALHALCEINPNLNQHFFHANGSVKDHFLLVVSGQVVTPETHICHSDGIDVMLATSGGAGFVGAAMLTDKNRKRYARHIELSEVGESGQLKLRNSSVLVVGTGGLGSPIAMYLTAAGVGCVGLVDFDRVDESNLQRQIIHGSDSIGIGKVFSAARRLKDLNPETDVRCHELTLNASNADELIRDYDVVVDGCDNYETRYVLSDACYKAGKPYVYGSINQFDGQVSVFHPQRGGPCYRCLYPSAPPQSLAPNLNNKGVFGVLPGVVGIIEATETIKFFLGIGEPLIGRLLFYNALEMKFKEIAFTARAECTTCGDQSALAA